MIRQPALRLAALASALLLLAALPGSGASAETLRPLPPLTARVTDLTGTLTPAQQAQIESRLAEFESRKGAQIAVLFVSSTLPEEIEQYSIRVVDAWKLGREKPDDGALLLVAKEDRSMRIEVGRGLEGALTDLVSKRIIADTITPLFRQGDYAGGIAAGVEQMIRVVDGEPLPAPD
ncbi:MAG: TPM domain-containing protein, partial [Gammaproteobacteria bacterium]|nr:TPM domain-containing protein [Gammaproteobacteria bacterium]